MAAADIFAILGAGAARGYRGAQERRRREAIEKRKQELEEEQLGRDKVRFEREGKEFESKLSVDSLERRKLLQELDALNVEAGRKRRPVGSGRLNLGGGIELEDPTYGDISDPHIARLLELRNRIEHPEIFGKTPRSEPRQKSKAEILGPIYQRILGRTPNILEITRGTFESNNRMLLRILQEELKNLGLDEAVVEEDDDGLNDDPNELDDFDPDSLE